MMLFLISVMLFSSLSLSLLMFYLACQEVATEIRAKIEEFRPFIPLIRGLGNSGMRSRHWELLSDRINVNVKLKANLTFSQCLELGLQDHVEEITRVAQEAGKEFAIEQVSNSNAGINFFIFISRYILLTFVGHVVLSI